MISLRNEIPIITKSVTSSRVEPRLSAGNTVAPAMGACPALHYRQNGPGTTPPSLFHVTARLGGWISSCSKAIPCRSRSKTGMTHNTETPKIITS